MLGFLVLSIGAGAAAAHAQEGPGNQHAERLAREKKLLEAAKEYARLISIAQRNRDVLQEQEVAASANRALTVATYLPPVDCMCALMQELDPDRNGAFVSAGSLATRIVFSATRAGDFRNVAAAAKVLDLTAKGKDSGKAARALSDYARAMLELAASKSEEGIEVLHPAFRAMVAEEWFEPSLHAGVELARAYLDSGNESAAGEVLTDVARIFPVKGDAVYSDIAERLIVRRLSDASEEILGPLKRAIPNRHSETTTRGDEKVTKVVPGLKGSDTGGEGVSAGARSELGRAFEKLPRSGILIRIGRHDTGFEILQVGRSKPGATQPFSPRVRHKAFEGAVLAFWGRAVATAQLDLIGNQGAPGDAYAAPYRAFYYLARREQYCLTRGGVVQIRRR